MKLPDKIIVEQVRIKSTVVGYVAYYHNCINKTSAEVFGNTEKEAIENLTTNQKRP